MGREVRSRTDYILRTDRRLFRNVAVRYPLNNSDHYLVLGCLCSAPLRDHTKFLGRRTRIPLQHLTTLTREDGLFAALRRDIPKHKYQEARENVWTFADTSRLVDKIVPACFSAG